MRTKRSHPLNLLAKNGNQGTHSVPLTIACLNTTGPVLELGCGIYSTTLLHSICGKHERKVHSVDHDERWLAKFSSLKTDWHTFEHVPGPSSNLYLNEFLYRFIPTRTRRIDLLWDQIGTGEQWGLVFVDHLPLARRVKEISRLRSSANVFVIHNTDRIGNFLFSFWQYLDSFPYIYEFPATPGTVVCSDTVNVRAFFE